MCYKILNSAIMVFLMLNAGCSSLEKVVKKVVYHPNINQGNYFTHNNLSKIHEGMTQRQVVCTLGIPVMSDPFGTNTWFYVFRKQSSYDGVIQQTIVLTFNGSGILTNIDNKFTLTK